MIRCPKCGGEFEPESIDQLGCYWHDSELRHALHNDPAMRARLTGEEPNLELQAAVQALQEFARSAQAANRAMVAFIHAWELSILDQQARELERR